MWFKILLTKIFHRDFTVRALTPDERERLEKAKAEAEESEIQGWTSDCTYAEQIFLGNRRHLCCDWMVSAVPCSNRRDACVGHYGVCCSNC